jgi:hypothetical protein
MRFNYIDGHMPNFMRWWFVFDSNIKKISILEKFSLRRMLLHPEEAPHPRAALEKLQVRILDSVTAYRNPETLSLPHSRGRDARDAIFRDARSIYR